MRRDERTLRRGIAVFDEIAQGVKDVQFLADPTAGELRIGCSIAIGTGFVATIIDRLSRRYPRIAFQILATDSRFAYQALVDREVDIALLHLVKPSADDLMQAETLFHDPQLVVAGAHHPLTRRRRLKLSDLANEPWVFPPPDAPYGAMVVEAFHAAGLDVPKAVVTSTLPLRSALLATGRFLSIVPGVVLRFPTPDLSLRRLPVDLPSTSRPLAFLTLKNRTLNPVAELFRDCAREIAGLRANDK